MQCNSLPICYILTYSVQWTYYGFIDLEFAACQEVQVSFKAVSKHGKSNYSPALNICVHGCK